MAQATVPILGRFLSESPVVREMHMMGVIWRILEARMPNAGESDMNLDFTRRDYPAGFGPDSVTLGDFNGDGLLDLAVADFLSNTVSVLLGNAGGSFQDATAYVVGRGPSSVAIG